MIIDTDKKYKLDDIMDLMSGIVSCRISNGSKIDFKRQFYIRSCTSLEDEIGKTYMVTIEGNVSVLTYIKGDFDDPTQNAVFIMDCMFEPGVIDDDTLKNGLKRRVAKFKLDNDGTYRLEGLSFNI